MCGASLNRDGWLRVPLRLHHPLGELSDHFLGELAPVQARKKLLCAGFAGALFPQGNLPLSESLSHLQFWGLQLLPYVGCLCLHDPSHINVIIRASIYILSSEQQLLVFAGEIYFIFLHGCGSGILFHFMFEDRLGGRGGRGRNGQRQKEKGLTHPTSVQEAGRDDQEHHTDLLPSRSGLPSMNSPSAAR